MRREAQRHNDISGRRQQRQSGGQWLVSESEGWCSKSNSPCDPLDVGPNMCGCTNHAMSNGHAVRATTMSFKHVLAPTTPTPRPTNQPHLVACDPVGLGVGFGLCQCGLLLLL